ncbi:MAG: DNA primase [Treponema sp.]|nr:DNA primase [Treponema sp.]
MAGFIKKETIDAVVHTADIVAIAGEYVPLTRKGSTWWGCCPFHKEKTPSFSVTPEKNMFYCFGCHKGGDVIKFVMEMEKLSYPEAIVQLAKRTGVEVRYEDGFNPELAKKDTTKDELIQLYERVSTMFHYLLTQTEGGKFALDYITKRGLSMKTIERFKLGYAPADRRWLKNFLRQKNFSDEFLAKSGLFSHNYPDIAFFSDRLMFPIFDRRGQCVAMGGRLLRGDGPKYLNSGDLIQYQKGETLYAFNFAKNAIRQEKKVIFCEGYMDCIAYHQCGIEYAVAPLGTALTEEQVKLVQAFTDTVLLSFDSDGAGQKATWKAILMCRKHNLTVKVIRLKGGKDPAEIMLNFGIETLTNDVNTAILDSDYILDTLSHTYPVDTPEGKTKACLSFFPYIDALQTDIQKESSLEQLGQRFNLSPEAVRRDFNNRDKVRERLEQRQPDAGQINNQNIPMDAEIRAILAVITTDTNQFELMRRELTENDFENQLAKNLFIILEECYREGDISFSTILSHCKDESIQQMITRSVASGEFSQNTNQMVADSIALIKRNSLEKQRDSLLNRIRTLNPATADDMAALNELLAEKMDIDNKLNKKD